MNDYSTISSTLLYYTCLELQDRGLALERMPQWQTVVRPLLNMQRPRVTFAQGQYLIEEALKLSGDENLGLAVGQRQTFASIGLLTSGLLACSSCQDALQFGIKYNRLTGSMLDMQFDSSPEFAGALVARPRDPTSPIVKFLVQELFANVTQIAKFLYRAGNPIRRLELIFDNTDAAIYRAVFQCPVEFGHSENRLIFSEQGLATRLETADPFALQSVVPVLDSLVANQSASQSLLSHIEALLTQHLPEVPNMPRIAKELGMSERGMRRKLAEAGTSFRETVDRVRQTRGLELTLQTAKSFEEIAMEIGFEDGRSLRRNFRKWTGKSPQELRTEFRAIKQGSAVKL